MNMQFARRMEQFGAGIFNVLDEKRREREAAGKKVYNLSIGTPDFSPAPHVMEALSQAARKPENYRYALSERPVGVDIQVVRPTWSAKLVDRTCTPEERAWLAGLGDRPEDFAALWACKESIGKESGYGLPYPPSRLAVPLPGESTAFSSQKIYALDGRFLRTYAGPGWQGAVCAWERPPEEIIWLELQ